MHVTIERNGKDFDATVTPVTDERSGLGMAGWVGRGEVQLAPISAEHAGAESRTCRRAI